MKHLLSKERSWVWWSVAILIIGLVRAITLLVILPSTTFVPDEGLYVFIVSSMREGLNPFDIGATTGYGPGVVFGSWLLVVPGMVLADLGVSDLMAIRIVSALFAVFSALLLLAILMIIRNPARTHSTAGRDEPRSLALPLLSAPGIALLIFMLMPSHALWSSLGLRDSSSIFASLIGGLGVALAVTRKPVSWRLVGAFLAAAGILGLQLSRSYLSGLMFLAVFAIAFWWPRRGKPRIAVLLILVSLGGFLAGQSIRNSEGDPNTITRPVEVLQEPSISGDPAVTESRNSEPAANSAAETPDGLLSELIGSAMNRIDSRVLIFSSNRRGFMESAESAYPYNYCLEVTETIEVVSCEIAHLPLGITRFLTSPVLNPLELSPKPFTLYASIENILWMAIFVSAAIMVIMRRPVNARFTTFLIVYGSLAIVGYALVSGNAGTVFRHKSQFLWVVCLIIGLSGSWRPWFEGLLASRRKTKDLEHTPLQSDLT